MERRGFFSALGASVVAATGALSQTAAAGGPSASGTNSGPAGQSGAQPAPGSGAMLQALLPVGTMVRGHRVTAIDEPRLGAQVVTLSGPDGDFVVEVCLRDDSSSAIRGPARSAKVELFLPNRGTGDLSTHEAHGLVAMDLASHIGLVEANLDTSALTTLSNRLRTYGPRVGSPR